LTWLGLDIATLLSVAAVFLLGGVVKGAIGFGLPLVTISILPLLVPLDLALAINGVMLPIANMRQFLRERIIGLTIRTVWPIMVGLVIGVPIGTQLLTRVSESQFDLGLGLFIIAFVGVTMVAPRFRLQASWSRPVALLVGWLAGTVGALTSANGPFFVMYLVAIGASRALFFSALGLLFVTTGLLIALSYAVAGLLTPQRLALALLFAIPAFGGMLVGNRLGNRLSVERFRLLVLGGLLLLGLNLIRRGGFP